MSDAMPEVRILVPEDQPALEAFLLPRLESSMFLIANSRASGLTDRGRPYEGTYAAAFENEKIVGVVAHCWNQNLLFQAPAHLGALWQAAAKASARPIGGLVGPDAQVGAALDALGIDDELIQMDEAEKLYSLDLADLVIPDALGTGQVCGRRIELRDLDRVAEWRVAYSQEALGEEDTHVLRASCRASVERALAEGHTWVLEHGRELVASSSFNAAISEAVQIGGVWTPPQLRRRGYGRAVVAASLRDARSEGVSKAILFTGHHNVPAQKAYEALGFRHIGDYRILLLRTSIDAPPASTE
jgi:ribosomal protein S18 acetylase RimI-like enzyme